MRRLTKAVVHVQLPDKTWYETYVPVYKPEHEEMCLDIARAMCVGLNNGGFEVTLKKHYEEIE